MTETISRLLKDDWVIILEKEDIIVIGKETSRMVTIRTPAREFTIYYEKEQSMEFKETCPSCHGEILYCISHVHDSIRFCNVNCTRDWLQKNKEVKEAEQESQK